MVGEENQVLKDVLWRSKIINTNINKIKAPQSYSERICPLQCDLSRQNCCANFCTSGDLPLPCSRVKRLGFGPMISMSVRAGRLHIALEYCGYFKKKVQTASYIDYNFSKLVI